jgi:hypothetical protein
LVRFALIMALQIEEQVLCPLDRIEENDGAATVMLCQNGIDLNPFLRPAPGSLLCSLRREGADLGIIDVNRCGLQPVRQP